MANQGVFIKDWLTKQTNRLAEDWGRTIEKFYPEHLKTWTDHKEQFRALMEDWNLLDAVKYLD